MKHMDAPYTLLRRHTRSAVQLRPFWVCLWNMPPLRTF